MIALRYAWSWQLAGIFLLVGVLIAALLPKLPFAELASQFRISDKMMHIVAFMFLATWFAGQYERRSYWRIAVGLLAFGVIIELVQGTVSYRTSEWMDLAGDALGISIGLLMAAFGQQ